MIHFPTSMFLKSHTSHFSASWRIRRDKHQAFTLIELLVVIVIIGILATLATVALTSSRANARDARRISDLKQISTGLELYYADNNAYPTTITFGSALVGANSKTYMAKVPTNPTPRAEGACGDLEYQYAGNTSDYSLIGCLAKASGEASAGARVLSVGGSARSLGPINGLVAWWPLDSINGLKDLTGNWPNATKNNAVLSAGRYGEAGGSYFLPGGTTYNASDMMLFTNPIQLSAAASICFWVKRLQGDYNADGSIIDAMYPHSFRLKEEGNGRLQILFGNGIDSGGVMTAFGVTGSLTPDIWQMYCMAFNGAGSGKVQFYKNNASIGSVASVLGSLGNKSSFVMGFSTASAKHFRGYVADIRFYNRDLNLAEVTAIYDATKP